MDYFNFRIISNLIVEPWLRNSVPIPDVENFYGIVFPEETSSTVRQFKGTCGEKSLTHLAITLATLALKKKSNRDVRNGFAMGRKDSAPETHAVTIRPTAKDLGRKNPDTPCDNLGDPAVKKI